MKPLLLVFALLAVWTTAWGGERICREGDFFIFRERPSVMCVDGEYIEMTAGSPKSAPPTDAFWNIQVENCVFYGPAWCKTGDNRVLYTGNKCEYTLKCGDLPAYTLEEIEAILKTQIGDPNP